VRPKSHLRLSYILGLFPVLIGLDQATKILAVKSMGDTLRDGLLVSDHARRAIGDWLWFFIAYNPGSAFSLAPQKLIPFLSPTVFFSLLTFVAIGFLVAYGRRHQESLLRIGAVCIAAGAVGNLLDRWRLDHVVDFISVGIPGVLWRWPTFNVADSSICVGVGVLLFGEWVLTWNGKPSGLGPRVSRPDVPDDALEATMTPEERTELHQHSEEKDA